MGKVQLEELEKTGKYFSVPRGISMRPMINNKEGIVEIHKLEGLAKRYDVVLYSRPGDQGVIHRVLWVKDGYYVIAGDNCWQREHVKFEQVAGIATRFYRKGKWHDCTETGYRIYSHFWADTFFIRRPFLYVRDKIKRKRLRSKMS